MQPALTASTDEEIAIELTALALLFHQRGQHEMYLHIIAIRDQLWDALDTKPQSAASKANTA